MPSADKQYDVFLSFNSEDRDEVERIAKYLEKKNIKPFFDEWELISGLSISSQISQGLENSAMCVIFIGKNGLGKWQNEELEVAQTRQIEIDPSFRVISVFLPETPADAKPPQFLATKKWIDFRGKKLDDREILNVLKCAISGKKVKERGLKRTHQLENSKTVDYKYDIFLSYDGGVAKWVEHCFLKAFNLCFEDELGRPPEIYKNIQTSPQNEVWPDSLKEALGYSRCLVPLWTPKYFIKKHWWRYEYSAMRDRIQTTSYRFFIIPFILCDGTTFPKAMGKITPKFNLNDFVFDEDFIRGFKDSPVGIEFHQEMRRKTKEIVPYITSVPSWSRDWLKEPKNIIPEAEEPPFPCPNLW